MDSDYEWPSREEDDDEPSKWKSGAINEQIRDILTKPDPSSHSSNGADTDSQDDEVPSGSNEDEDEDEDEDEENGLEEGKRYSLKRPADSALDDPQPFKRHKGVLNVDYLDLLNRDIEDASHRVYLEDDAHNIEASQLGLTFWSRLEKKLFFEALARLGRDNLPGIASFIGTKSVVEVNHYLHILGNGHQARLTEGLEPPLEVAEYPAAIELSQQCCHALDEAADAVSVRQERKEEQREEGKWGAAWDITPRLARKLDKGEEIAGDRPLTFVPILNTSAWLTLSERIFMNSSIPSDNWHFIDDHLPSMWATTFEDFYSLALSFTRRLVQTTIFISMSRIRAKKELVSSTRGIVRRSDVEAAVTSLGLELNSHEFWRKCARRLRLKVYHEPPDRSDEDAAEEPLTFDEVEAALAETELLGTETPDSGSARITIRDRDLIQSIKDEDGSDEEFELASDDDKEGILSPSEDEESGINQEALEVLQYSAADFPETYRTKQSLKNRIAMERQQELYAETCDQYANHQAETEMWELLQRKPPMEIPKPPEPGPLLRSKMDVESMYPIGRGWRTRINFRSQWEDEKGS